MKTMSETLTTEQAFKGIITPMFLPSNMEQPMATEATTQAQETELSLLDVKELYDLAYAEKAKDSANEDTFKKILAEAVKLDLAYRRQLAKAASYKEPSKLENFGTASEGVKVA